MFPEGRVIARKKAVRKHCLPETDMALVLLPSIALSSMAAKDIYILSDGAVVYSLKYSFSINDLLTETVADHKS